MRTSDLLTCPMCSTRFDPAGHEACAACPLQRGCQLVCCPTCGYELVDPGKSALARLASRFFARRGGGIAADSSGFFEP